MAFSSDITQANKLLQKYERALNLLFEEARNKDELNFALSLSPEFKAYTLTSAMDAQRAFRDYSDFLNLEQFSGQSIRVRIAMAFYCHIAEAAGLWGVPMCMLLVRAGAHYDLSPFSELVKRHPITGQTIAPNANKTMRYLAEEAKSQGLHELAEVFRDAFDADLRNAFAHSDYALSPEGILVRGRHDQQRTITWQEFGEHLSLGTGLFGVLQQVIAKYEKIYQTPKIVMGTTSDHDPMGTWLIYSNPNSKSMTVTGGPGCTTEFLLKEHARRQNEQSIERQSERAR